MIYGAEKNLYKPMAEVLFDVFLQYHAQLNDDTDFKWMSWYMATSGNYAALKKMKQKLLRYILKHGAYLKINKLIIIRIAFKFLRKSC